MPLRIRRALISTTNKKGIVEFASELAQLDIEILATAGSALILKKHGIPVVALSDYTGFPEILGGRVKTLHPKIYAGLLRRSSADDPVLKQHHIEPIDLLVINLYPFSETIAAPQCSFEEAIENIDVGGPSLLRAGAKNHALVTVLTDPKDYLRIVAEIRSQGGNTTLATRRQLAKKTFAYLADYDAEIAAYFAKQSDSDSESRFP